VRGLAGVSEARITFIGGEQKLDRPSRRVAVGYFQEFAPSFGFSEARRLFFSLSRLPASLLACRYDKRRPHGPHPRPSKHHIMEMTLRASSPRATSLAVRCYEVRCRFPLSRPIISLFSAPHMHVAWKQVFGREMASRTYRYFDFDRGFGYSTGADHRSKLGEPAVWIPSCLHVPEPAHEGLVHPMVRVHCGMNVRDCGSTCNV
jgi:hypothetical protein